MSEKEEKLDQNRYYCVPVWELEEENCYNCTYYETFENGVVRCTHIPKGTTKPCPYFLRGMCNAR